MKRKLKVLWSKLKFAYRIGHMAYTLQSRAAIYAMMKVYATDVLILHELLSYWNQLESASHIGVTRENGKITITMEGKF